MSFDDFITLLSDACDQFPDRSFLDQHASVLTTAGIDPPTLSDEQLDYLFNHLASETAAVA